MVRSLRITNSNLLWILPGYQVFTNSDRRHAKKVLERLGIEEELFQCIICFETLNPHLFQKNNTSIDVILKPSISAVEEALRVAGSDPHLTVREQDMFPCFSLDLERMLLKTLGMCYVFPAVFG